MGGFVQENESVDDAARRVLAELTGLTDIYMEQIGTFGEVRREPHERVVSVAYYALINIDDYNNEFDSAADFSMVVGPAFRYNLNDMHGFFLSPGLIGTLSVASDTEDSITQTLVNFDLGFNIDAGYRVWFLNTDSFHLGMNVGAQYSIGGGLGTAYFENSSSDASLEESYDLNAVQRFKVYIGVIMNFGDRGWDKFNY